MNSLKILTASLAFAATTFPAIAQNATPIAMSMSMRMRMILDGNGDLTFSQSQSGLEDPAFQNTPYVFNTIPPNPLSSSFYYLGPINDYYQGAGSRFRALTNFDSGDFAFEYGWDRHANPDWSGDLPGGSLFIESRWAYEFMPNVNGTLRLNFDLIPGNFFMFTEATSCGLGCPGAVGGSGSFDFALNAGQNFRIGVWNIWAKTFALNSFGTSDFVVGDRFSYQIIPSQISVPEPASWALMIAGFGAVGAAMRRRAKVRVTYA